MFKFKKALEMTFRKHCILIPLLAPRAQSGNAEKEVEACDQN